MSVFTSIRQRSFIYESCDNNVKMKGAEEEKGWLWLIDNFVSLQLMVNEFFLQLYFYKYHGECIAELFEIFI